MVLRGRWLMLQVLRRNKMAAEGGGPCCSDWRQRTGIRKHANVGRSARAERRWVPGSRACGQKLRAAGLCRPQKSVP